MRKLPKNTKFILKESSTKKVVVEFCESTSLHGYGYLQYSNSFSLKIFWIFVILSMTGISIAFFVTNTQQYFNARIITNIESSTNSLSVSVFTITFDKYYRTGQDRTG